MNLTENETRLLVNWNLKQNAPVQLQLVSTDDPRSSLFEAFCETLITAAPKIHVFTEKIKSMEPPAFVLNEQWRFHIIPNGAELEPFLRIASHGEGEDSSAPEHLESRMKALLSEAELLIFVSHQCPFCPHAVSSLVPLGKIARVQMTIVDGELFPEVAMEHNIRSVPTVIINEVYRLTGTIQLVEVVEIIEKADPSLMGTEALKRMLKEGQASLLARMMIDRKQMFPNFHPLLSDSNWNVRLGAMVVVEEVAEFDESLARTILNDIWKAFPNASEAARGDIIYLIGELGGDSWIPVLESSIQEEQDDEVRSLIVESLSKLNEKPV